MSSTEKENKGSAMKCPSCNKKFNVNSVAAVALSRSYDCPACRSKLIKNSNTS